MDDYFHVLQGIHQTAIALITTSVSLVQANQKLIAATQTLTLAGESITRTTEAALHARDEHEDVRVSVARLEKLVRELLDRDHGKVGTS